jgi:hypothetical protein
MCPGSEASFNATDVVGQIGFASDEKGRGTAWSTIQRIGKRTASENRFSSCAAVASSASGPIAAASIMAAAKATTCWAKGPLAIARIGVAVSNAVRREEAIDKFGSFERGFGPGRGLA